MDTTRREWSALAALLAAAQAARAAADKPKLPTVVKNRDEVSVTKSGQAAQRKYFDGVTHEGIPFEVHESELPPGGAPHPPHRHGHEEMAIVIDGTLEVTVEGKSPKNLGPGGLVYVASGEMHGWRNPSNSQVKYLIIAVGHD